MDNQKHLILNQGISTPVGILIIVLVTIIAGGGILAYQYWWIPTLNFSRQLEICDEEYKQTKSYLCYVKMGKDYPNKITELCNRIDVGFQGKCLSIFKTWQVTEFRTPLEDILKEVGQKAERDVKRITHLLQIRLAIEMYYNFEGNKQYPVSKGLEKINDESCILHKALQPYFTPGPIPIDPKNSEFWYTYESDGENYELTVRLENLENENCIMENNICFYKCNKDNCGKLYWKTYRNEDYGYEIKYPEELDTSYVYIHQSTWPPQITVKPIDPNFICEEFQNKKISTGYGNQKEVILNNSKYCLLTVGEGTAGTIYVTYKYITDKNSKQLTLVFVLKFPNCGTTYYSIDNKMQECQKEQKDFEPTVLIDKILSTFRFLE